MKSSRLLAEQLNLVTYKIILTSLSAHVLFDSKHHVSHLALISSSNSICTEPNKLIMCVGSQQITVTKTCFKNDILRWTK